MTESSTVAAASDDAVVDTTSTTDTSKTTDVSTESSSAPTEAKSMLDAVKSALKPTDATPASQTSGSSDDTDDPAETDKTPPEPDEPPDDEKKNWSARTSKRFQQLSTNLTAERTRTAELAPKAQEFDKLETYVRRNGLTPDDVQGSLVFAALMRNDPYEARKVLLPIMQQLDAQTGNVIPPDLQARVDQGYLSPEDALAFSRAASHAHLAEQKLTQRTEAQERHEQQQTQRAQFTQTTTSVEAWEKAKSRDPDWHSKQPQVAEQVELEITRRRMREPQWLPSPQEAVKLADTALKRVNERMKSFTPRSQEIRPIATDTTAASRSAPAPKTMFDVVKQSVGRG